MLFLSAFRVTRPHANAHTNADNNKDHAREYLQINKKLRKPCSWNDIPESDRGQSYDAKVKAVEEHGRYIVNVELDNFRNGASSGFDHFQYTIVFARWR